MKTIDKFTKYEETIKNSKFICLLYKIKDINNIPNILKETKETYKDATHYCYAYNINGIKKANDDKEPSGTAGIPLLKVIDNYQLDYILAIVVRYFGGIKLGANGLIRAYTKCISKAINQVEIKELISGYIVEIEFNYNQTKEIDHLLKNINIIEKNFQNNIIYKIEISKNNLKILIDNNIEYKILSNTLIEKTIP